MEIIQLGTDSRLPSKYRILVQHAIVNITHDQARRIRSTVFLMNDCELEPFLGSLPEKPECYLTRRFCQCLRLDRDIGIDQSIVIIIEARKFLDWWDDGTLSDRRDPLLMPLLKSAKWYALRRVILDNVLHGVVSHEFQYAKTVNFNGSQEYRTKLEDAYYDFAKRYTTAHIPATLWLLLLSILVSPLRRIMIAEYRKYS